MAPYQIQTRSMRAQTQQKPPSRRARPSGLQKAETQGGKSNPRARLFLRLQSHYYEHLFASKPPNGNTAQAESKLKAPQPVNRSLVFEAKSPTSSVSTDYGESTKALMAQTYLELHLASITSSVSLSTLLDAEGTSSYLSAIDVGSRISFDAVAMLEALDSAAAFHDVDAKPSGEMYASDADVASDKVNAAKLFQLASIRARTTQRYGAFATSHGWMILSILAFSATFRHCCSTPDLKAWDLLSMAIKHNSTSLEIFAKVRALDWKSGLTYVSTKRPSTLTLDLDALLQTSVELKPGSPHSYVVCEGRSRPRRPVFQGRKQINIDDSIYVAERFEGEAAPHSWPAGISYPSNPTTRKFTDGPCSSCFSMSWCSCNPRTCAIVTRPLVELRDYGNRGVGIRALQRIEKGDILGDYVGVLLPPNHRSDPVYSFAFVGKGGARNEVLASISAKEYGNWTRYLNHSCQAATCFVSMFIGQKARVMVKTLRDIDIFEEVTVDYGREYWKRKKCLCGEIGCYNPA